MLARNSALRVPLPCISNPFAVANVICFTLKSLPFASRTKTTQRRNLFSVSEGRKLLRELGQAKWPIHLLIDRAYEAHETRQLALDLNFIPVVPPKSNRVNAWEYDRAMYKRRNEIERLLRRLKGFRRIFSRFEKLDVMFIAFITFALIVEAPS